MTIESIEQLERNLAEHDNKFSGVKNKWVGLPLNHATNVGKLLFTWTVGLGWLLHLVYKIKIRSHEVELPTISYDGNL